MDKQFDELSKSLANGVSRRVALRKFGIGVAGALLAAVGLSSRAEAGGSSCTTGADCGGGRVCCGGQCLNISIGACACTNPCPNGTTCKPVKIEYYGKHVLRGYACV